MSNDLLFTPATKAADLIRKKKLSPVEYVDAVLSAVERLQPKLNCYITITADQARKEAKAAEQAVMRGDALGPLHGVPIGVKDLLPTKGVRTTLGSAVYANNIPDVDDIIVTRLKAAGAIMIGKNTTPEFGIKGQTDAPLYGVTRNPWDLTRTPGGSSGGGAASVAAGLGPLAVGTDGAGSTRIPAACCGLVGLKGTTGAVPYQQARDAFSNPVAAGPLARTVADAVLMQSVMAGPDPMDPWTHEAAPLDRVSPRLLGGDLTGIRIGYLARCANPRLSREVEQATKSALELFAGFGATVDEVSETIDWIMDDQRVLYLCSIANNLGPLQKDWAGKLDPVLDAYIERGRQFGIADYIKAINAKTRLFRAVQGLFAKYDYLVSPSLTRTAIPADFNSATGSVDVDGVDSGSTQPAWTGYQYPFNLTGHPAVSIPNGFGADGLPIGLQIIGPRHADGDVMRLAAMFEAARPWADHRPPIAA